MLVVYLASTNAVVGVATRRTAGAPPVEDLVGTGLPVRNATLDSGVIVAADNLAVKEVDYAEDVIREPLTHGLDASGQVVVVTPTIGTITCTSVKVSFVVTSTVADKTAVVIIDLGANRDPLKFTTKTLALSPVDVPVTGVPPGTHNVFISVDGFVSALGSGSFS
jgi:hypothetical protein